MVNKCHICGERLKKEGNTSYASQSLWKNKRALEWIGEHNNCYAFANKDLHEKVGLYPNIYSGRKAVL
jgi:hypothetical protein